MLRERAKTRDKEDKETSDDEGIKEDEEDSILLSAIEEIESTFALRSELDVSLRQLERSKQSAVYPDLLEKEREEFDERLNREVEKKTKTLEVRKSAAENAADQARKKFAEAGAKFTRVKEETRWRLRVAF